jgi:hypothetical protein
MKLKARLSLFATVLILAVTVAGCPPPPPNPIPDPGDAGEVDAEPIADAPECSSPASCACETLCRLECEDCLPECVETIEHVIMSRIIAFDPECVAKATTKEEVRKCPGIRCR